ncbi:CRISPR-associated helicase Cas3' [Chitinophaga sp. HK235]|uniref:CRISPR-associated helicase Cas3' n=1 Tax=Chitinophaga sp. HK235 TaxID=2952571 RepID=UPI001BA9EAB7|nr:CRISPR-associated helicase Cas3' [Chitinophaga sp. HK235]
MSKNKNAWQNLLAKKKVQLHIHLEQVALAIECIAQNLHYSFDRGLARKGAVLHDVAKAHPHFQRKIRKKRNTTLVEEVTWGFIHRHELSSLAFLPAFPRSEWDVLIDMVVAHHRSIIHDPREQGILDLDNNDRHWIALHLYAWEDWFPYGRSILNHFGYDCPEISKEEAGAAMQYAVEYCSRKKNGWSPWRGLLMAADHFASAFTYNTGDQLQHLFVKPDLSVFHPKAKNPLYPLADIPASDNRQHTLVVYPTSSGKTYFLIRRCKGRIAYMLPYQASINAMSERLREKGLEVRIQHGTSSLVVNKNNVAEKMLQSLVGASVKVMTPHQVAGIIFGTAGFESVMLDLMGCDVILDEIHTYAGISQSMVVEIVKTLLRLHCRIHIGSATMPACLYNALLEVLGGPEQVYEVKATPEVLDTYDRHIIFKLEDDTGVPELLQKAIAGKEKVLLVFNTVEKAQRAMLKYEKMFPAIPVLLIHAGFSWMFRYAAEEQLKQLNKKKKSPCIVIATQVVEVSLDISFDLMVTECAPLESLIQRMGRIHRERKERTQGTYKPIYVLAPKGSPAPYKQEILEKSYALLPPDGEPLRERDLQEKLDALYPALDLPEMDMHLIYREGRYAIRELTNIRQATLLKIMGADSLTCILKEDEKSYLEASWEERRKMEIPISWYQVKINNLESTQLDVGSKPFVVKQSRELHQKYGLFLKSDNTDSSCTQAISAKNS